MYHQLWTSKSLGRWKGWRLQRAQWLKLHSPVPSCENIFVSAGQAGYSARAVLQQGWELDGGRASRRNPPGCAMSPARPTSGNNSSPLKSGKLVLRGTSGSRGSLAKPKCGDPVRLSCFLKSRTTSSSAMLIHPHDEFGSTGGLPELPRQSKVGKFVRFLSHYKAAHALRLP